MALWMMLILIVNWLFMNTLAYVHGCYGVEPDKLFDLVYGWTWFLMVITVFSNLIWMIQLHG